MDTDNLEPVGEKRNKQEIGASVSEVDHGVDDDDGVKPYVVMLRKCVAAS